MMIIIIKIARAETAITVPRHPTATLTILTHHLSYYERISRRYRDGKVFTFEGEEKSACQKPDEETRNINQYAKTNT